VPALKFPPFLFPDFYFRNQVCLLGLLESKLVLIKTSLDSGAFFFFSRIFSRFPLEAFSPSISCSSTQP